MRLDEAIPPPSLPPVVPSTRLQLPAPTPIHPVATASTLPPVSVTEFYVDTFHAPAVACSLPTIQYPVAAAPVTTTLQYPQTTHHPTHPVTLAYPHVNHHQEAYQQHPTYQQQPPPAPHPTFASYSPFVPDPKRHVARSPVSGKFVRGGPLQPKTQQAPKERKRPGPKSKVKQESEPKPPDEPEYAPEVIANAHLTMDDDYYVCSVCKMKFKQPGNARRHIITVHRNEKNHECLKCNARFGRKVGY